MKKLLCLFLFLFTIVSCNFISRNKVYVIGDLTGIWKNISLEHNYIMFSYSLNDIKENKVFWATFPLELNPNDPNEIDTTYLYKNPSYSGGFKIEKDSIAFTYQNNDNQGYYKNGKIIFIDDKSINTPIGEFVKLSK